MSDEMSDAADEESDEPIITNRDMRRILRGVLEAVPEDDNEADVAAMHKHLQTAFIAHLVEHGMPVDEIRQELAATDAQAFGKQTIDEMRIALDREANAS